MAISVKQKAKLAAWVLVAAAVATSPITVSAASDSKNTVINATVNSVISMTTSGTVNVSVTPTGSGAISSSSDTVQVSTNNAAGYELTIADSDATLTLGDGTNTIATNADAPAAASVLSGNEWGWAVASGTVGASTNTFSSSYAGLASQATTTEKYAGISATPFKIKDTSSVATNDATTVWFAVNANTSQPASTGYTNTVTYTATTN